MSDPSFCIPLSKPDNNESGNAEYWTRLHDNIRALNKAAKAELAGKKPQIMKNLGNVVNSGCKDEEEEKGDWGVSVCTKCDGGKGEGFKKFVDKTLFYLLHNCNFGNNVNYFIQCASNAVDIEIRTEGGVISIDEDEFKNVVPVFAAREMGIWRIICVSV